MDRNPPGDSAELSADAITAPTYVEPSANASIDATNALIKYIRALPPPPGGAEPLVRPILTPRFALSCSHELLGKLRKVAVEDPGLHIQTHISENAREIALTLEQFPPDSLPAPPTPLPVVDDVNGAKAKNEGGTYAGVYDAFGLLRKNTVLAHAVHLNEEEVAIIKARGAGISHCPTSNFNLRSGRAPVGMLLDHGIKVRLELLPVRAPSYPRLFYR